MQFKKLLYIVLALFCVSTAGFSQEKNQFKNSLYFGYNQMFSEVEGTLFKGGSILGKGDNTSYSGYIGLEMLFNPYVGLTHTFTFGYSDYTPDNPNERLRQRDLYNIDRKQPMGFYFNYDIGLRVFLGVPYVYIDSGFGFGTRQMEYSHLAKVGKTHQFIVDSVEYDFEPSWFIALGVAIPLGTNDITLNFIGMMRTIFISSLGSSKPKYIDNGDTHIYAHNDSGNFQEAGFKAELKFKL